jgi:predicted Holliday junction resolvase-like endonuclease
MEWRLLLISIITCVALYFVYRKLVEFRNEIEDMQDAIEDLQQKQLSGGECIPVELRQPNVLPPFLATGPRPRSDALLSSESQIASLTEDTDEGIVVEEIKENDILQEINQGFEMEDAHTVVETNEPSCTDNLAVESQQAAPEQPALVNNTAMVEQAVEVILEEPTQLVAEEQPQVKLTEESSTEPEIDTGLAEAFENSFQQPQFDVSTLVEPAFEQVPMQAPASLEQPAFEQTPAMLEQPSVLQQATGQQQGSYALEQTEVVDTPVTIQVNSVKQIQILPKNQLPKKYDNESFLSNNNISNTQERAMVEAWRTMSLNNLQVVAKESGLEVVNKDKTVIACKLVFHKVPFVYMGKRYVIHP